MTPQEKNSKCCEKCVFHKKVAPDKIIRACKVEMSCPCHQPTPPSTIEDIVREMDEWFVSDKDEWETYTIDQVELTRKELGELLRHKITSLLTHLQERIGKSSLTFFDNGTTDECSSSKLVFGVDRYNEALQSTVTLIETLKNKKI